VDYLKRMGDQPQHPEVQLRISDWLVERLMIFGSLVVGADSMRGWAEGARRRVSPEHSTGFLGRLHA
jgi:hypothetical protein